MNTALDSHSPPRLLAEARDLMQRQVEFHGTQVGKAEALARVALVEAVALILVIGYLLREGAQPGPITIGVLVVASLACALALVAVRLLERGGPPPLAMAGPRELDAVVEAARKKGATMATGEDPTLAICAFLVATNTHHLVRTSRLISAAVLALVAAGGMVVEAMFLIAADAVQL